MKRSDEGRILNLTEDQGQRIAEEQTGYLDNTQKGKQIIHNFIEFMPLTMQERFALFYLEPLIIDSRRLGIIAMKFFNKLRTDIADLLPFDYLLQLKLLLPPSFSSVLL